jgi:hypothetical protein
MVCIRGTKCNMYVTDELKLCSKYEHVGYAEVV